MFSPFIFSDYVTDYMYFRLDRAEDAPRHGYRVHKKKPVSTYCVQTGRNTGYRSDVPARPFSVSPPDPGETSDEYLEWDWPVETRVRP